MRPAIFVVFLATLLILSLDALGQKPAESAKPGSKPAVSAAELEAWIERLAHSDFHVRQEAIHKLRNAGVDAIPILEQALTKHQDVNIQRHLKEILASYQTVPQLLPTRVQLKLDKVTVQEAVQALAKATGYRFEFVPVGDPADGQVVYDWNWQNVTFWEALQDLCDRAGISYVEGWYSHDGKTVRLESGEAHPSYTSLSGPFRVTVVGFSYNRNVSFLTGPKRWNAGSTIQRHESLQLNLRVAIEPRYAFVAVHRVNVEEAEDENGVSRAPPRQNDNEPFASFYYGGGRMYQQQVALALLPGNLGGKLKKLRGTVSALVIANERPWITVENAYAARGKRLDKGEISFQVDDIKDDGQMVQVKVQIWRRGGGQRHDGAYIHTAHQRIKAYDAQGRELRPAGAMSWSNDQDSAHGTLGFHREQAVAAGPAVGIGRILGGKPKPEETIRVVYHEWDIVPVQVPFDFRDVPLP
ncbi:MAG: hypothetical protein NZM42_06225 [Gemmatales bacterium]|nr:hypothetical protein [Gemmatales bacterium]MDW8221802.1 hypothetical protein [Gemmatales bacterium]